MRWIRNNSSIKLKIKNSLLSIWTLFSNSRSAWVLSTRWTLHSDASSSVCAVHRHAFQCINLSDWKTHPKIWKYIFRLPELESILIVFITNSLFPFRSVWFIFIFGMLWADPGRIGWIQHNSEFVIYIFSFVSLFFHFQRTLLVSYYLLAQSFIYSV